MDGKQRSVAAFLFLAVMFMITGTGAVADAEMRRVVIGADLDEAQVNAVYTVFGISRGEVPELRLTNEEERAALTGYVDAAIIGTKSLSCVYLELLPAGSGIRVETENISWYTPEMYTNALMTAGITDAGLVVTAPFLVSGTAALAGVYKAYESMTGQKLDDLSRTVSTQELTVTGELAEEIGSSDSTSIINELKLMLDETAEMSDDEIRLTIRMIAEKYHVSLTDAQVQQLLDLCRSMEKLNPNQLREQVENVQNTLQKVSDAKSQVVSFAQTIGGIFHSIRDFFDRIAALFNRP